MDDPTEGTPVRPEEQIDSAEVSPSATKKKVLLWIILGLLLAALGGSALVATSSMAPDAAVKGRGFIEVDLTKIPEGEAKHYNIESFQAEGDPYPVLVLHRNKHIIDLAENSGGGKFPEADSRRVVRKDWLILSARSTHLGCTVEWKPEEYDLNSGSEPQPIFLDPCHGGQFDTSGRLIRGPGKGNLILPEVKFFNDKKVRISPGKSSNYMVNNAYFG